VQVMPSMWWNTRIAIATLSITGTVAPVMPLALVPANSPSVGIAYGTLDSLFYIGQGGSTLLIGAARQSGGFSCALKFVLFELAAGVSFALGAACCAKEAEPSRPIVRRRDLASRLAAAAGRRPFLMAGRSGRSRGTQSERWRLVQASSAASAYCLECGKPASMIRVPSAGVGLDGGEAHFRERLQQLILASGSSGAWPSQSRGAQAHALTAPSSPEQISLLLLPMGHEGARCMPS